jgi:putative tryptophan/tyrosine transport system substrate-binding protein
MKLRPIGTMTTFALSCLLALLAAHVQPAVKVPRIGILEPGPPEAATPRPCLEGFRHGLGDLGYHEGKTITLDYRYAESEPDRLPGLATDLVQHMPDAIFTHTPAAALAAKQATTTIPIVVGVASDVVELGIVESLAQPGGNLTGLELRDTDLTGKRLELLKEAVPQIARVAILVNPTYRAHDRIPSDFEAEARVLGIQVQRVEASDALAFEGAFAAMANGQVDALVILDTALTSAHRQRILELALTHRLPTISGGRHFAAAGSLLAYGAYVGDMCHRAAVQIDKILKGAKPGSLPVEQPTKFELVINLKTATALGLTIPPAVLFQADEVIQ